MKKLDDIRSKTAQIQFVNMVTISRRLIVAKINVGPIFSE